MVSMFRVVLHCSEKGTGPRLLILITQAVAIAKIQSSTLPAVNCLARRMGGFQEQHAIQRTLHSRGSRPNYYRGSVVEMCSSRNVVESIAYQGRKHLKK